DGVDRFAQRGFGFRADKRNALLILPLNLNRADGVVDSHQVLGGHYLALGSADENVLDVVLSLAFILAQSHHDRILVSVLAVLSRLCAGDVGSNRVGQRSRADSELGGLGPVNAHGKLGTALVATESGIGDA